MSWSTHLPLGRLECPVFLTDLSRNALHVRTYSILEYADHLYEQVVHDGTSDDTLIEGMVFVIYG